MIAHQFGDHRRVPRVVVIESRVALTRLIRADTAGRVKGAAAALQHERADGRPQRKAGQKQDDVAGESQRLLGGQGESALNCEQKAEQGGDQQAAQGLADQAGSACGAHGDGQRRVDAAARRRCRPNAAAHRQDRRHVAGQGAAERAETKTCSTPKCDGCATHRSGSDVEDGAGDHRRYQ